MPASATVALAARPTCVVCLGCWVLEWGSGAASSALPMAVASGRRRLGEPAGWRQLPKPWSLHPSASSPLPQHKRLLCCASAAPHIHCLAASSALLPHPPAHCPAALQILGKLTSLPFQQCKHHISSLDAQPSLSSGVLVFVTGQLLVSHRAQGGVLCCCCQPPLLLLLPPFIFHSRQAVGRRRQPAAAAALVGGPPGGSHLHCTAALCCPVPQPEGETNPLKFSQTFHLAPVGGSYVVTNGERAAASCCLACHACCAGMPPGKQAHLLCALQAVPACHAAPLT